MGLGAVAAAVLSAALVAPAGIEPVDAAPAPVHRGMFGMHAISTSATAIPGAKAVRLWDTDTTWRVLNPAPGVYDWTTLDARIQDAVDSQTTVLLVLGATPEWAATSLSDADADWLGPGSAAPPRSMLEWTAFVREVVKRYGGRIEAYQIWNEPADPIFWRGSWDLLARMTEAASAVIRWNDSSATVVGAPMILRGPDWEGKAREYVDALAGRGMPVDVMAFHGYADGPPGEGKADDVGRLQEIVARSPAAGLPLWETEVNFTQEAGDPSLPSTTKREWLARAYLDAVRHGVERVYWYAFADIPDILAVDIRRRSVLPAFSAVSSWLAEGAFWSCSDSWQRQSGITGCSFLDSSGQTGVALWAESPSAVVVGRGTVRDLSGREWSMGDDLLVVRTAPLWFQPAPLAG